MPTRAGRLDPESATARHSRDADPAAAATSAPCPSSASRPTASRRASRTFAAVLGSAGRELWRYFPGHQIEPFVVARGHGGPTVLYARNPQGEIVVKLDTEGTFWCQYAYQFSCLFADILCGFNEKSVGNKWFEVSVCEAASLFALKQMSQTWERDPPYPNWKDYRHALAKYAQSRSTSGRSSNRKDSRSSTRSIGRNWPGGGTRGRSARPWPSPC